MRLLLTNDDGIGAEGLQRLAGVAALFGETWIVAPDGQRSAASHSITLHRPVDVCPYDFPVKGVRAWSCSGTPADCARIGLLYLMNQRPDVVLSGINHGYNTAGDIQYSGTVGAAFEAERQGVQGIALSEGIGSDHRLTDERLPVILEALLKRKLPAGQIFNVNFPGCAPEECRGVVENRAVSRASLYVDRYKKTESLPEGGIRLCVDGFINEEAEKGTDLRAVMDGYITIGIISNIR